MAEEVSEIEQGVNDSSPIINEMQEMEFNQARADDRDEGEKDKGAMVFAKALIDSGFTSDEIIEVTEAMREEVDRVGDIDADTKWLAALEGSFSEPLTPEQAEELMISIANTKKRIDAARSPRSLDQMRNKIDAVMERNNGQ